MPHIVLNHWNAADTIEEVDLKKINKKAIPDYYWTEFKIYLKQIEYVTTFLILNFIKSEYRLGISDENVPPALKLCCKYKEWISETEYLKSA